MSPTIIHGRIDDGAGSGVAVVEFASTAARRGQRTAGRCRCRGRRAPVQFRATDEAGNVEAARSALVKVDTVTPVAAAAATPTQGRVASH